MSEGAFHKYQQFVFDKTDIGFAWKFSFVASVAEASMPKGLFQCFLRPGIFAPDPGHVEGALLGGIKTVFLTEFGTWVPDKISWHEFLKVLPKSRSSED